MTHVTVSVDIERAPGEVFDFRWVEAVGNGARVTAVVTGDASGVFRFFTPLLNWMVHRSIQKDYARLKQLLESQTPPFELDQN